MATSPTSDLEQRTGLPAVCAPASHRPPPRRQYSLIDRLIAPMDQALRTLSGTVNSSRPYPGTGIEETLVAKEAREQVISLMRINHAGEVAAQALYQGQAAVANSSELREQLLAAGREELDHLDWCAQRINELGAKPSLLSPLWYAGSFAIGVLAGLMGKRHSLGFVAETERQVVDHLQLHLRQLPNEDARTRAIIEQMQRDEQHHGSSALSAGGSELPTFVRAFMKATAKVMTHTASRI